MRRKELIDKIVKYTGIFVQEVKSYNAIGSYDINMHAENALIPILNAVFDINLVNANIERQNHPAIDLYDQSNSIAFQITSTASMDKVTDTIEKFIKHGIYKTAEVLYIYILTEKEKSYSASKIQKLIGDKFAFDIDAHIIDYSDILKFVNQITSLEKLEAIARLYEHEFSGVQVDARKRIYQDGYLLHTKEPVFANLLRLEFSEKLYIGESNLNYEEILQNINTSRARNGRKALKEMDRNKIFYSTAKRAGIVSTDWVMRENRLITFRDLTDKREPLSQFVDRGTVDSISPQEYFQTNDDHLNTFKDLLRRCLTEFCGNKEMEWVNDRQILRFKNFPEMPRQRSTRWVGKKESTKTIIFEMMSKAKERNPSHVICFRSMAFRPSFHLLDDTWYLSVNPTWSFTNPGGVKTSRFEPDYMSGLKRMENNNTVYYQYRFFAYYLTHTPPSFY